MNMKKILSFSALLLSLSATKSMGQAAINGTIVMDTTVGPASPQYKVWLILYNSTAGTLTAVDSTTVTSYPHMYLFGSVPAGTYRVKAALTNGPTSGPGFVPTYHDSSLFWNTANTITHSSTPSVGNNIYMKYGTVTSGPGFVGGNVSAGANKGTGAGLPGMTIFILDNADKLVNVTTTDASGNFSFSNLPTGSYKVRPEDMNYTTTPIPVTVTVGQPTVNNIDFERSKSQKTITPKSSGISTVSNSNKFAVYPNPANDKLTVKWNAAGNANIRIADVAGKTVLSTSGASGVQIDVANLQKGVYFITVEAGNASTTQKVVLQ